VTDEREPIRLRDDPAEDAGLRAMLDAARGEHADDAMLDRVLAAVIASGGGGGGGGGGGAAGGKIAAALGATVIGAGAIALWMSSTSAPAPSHTPTHIADAAIVSDAFVALDAFSAPSDAGADARFVRTARPPPTSAPPPTETDAALMMRVVREHDPAAQLALAGEHRARFPDSSSSEDREALIVIDLARLGRTTEADAAAATFRARWPHSAAQSHIDTELARARATP